MGWISYFNFWWGEGTFFTYITGGLTRVSETRGEFISPLGKGGFIPPGNFRGLDIFRAFLILRNILGGGRFWKGELIFFPRERFQQGGRENLGGDFSTFFHFGNTFFTGGFILFQWVWEREKESFFSTPGVSTSSNFPGFLTNLGGCGTKFTSGPKVMCWRAFSYNLGDFFKRAAL